jgi:hypothetical protein
MDPNDEIYRMLSEETRIPWADREDEIEFQFNPQNNGDVPADIALIPLMNDLRTTLVFLQKSLDRLTDASIRIVARYILLHSFLSDDYSFASNEDITITYDMLQEIVNNANENRYEADVFFHTCVILEAEITRTIGLDVLLEVFGMETSPGFK